MSNTQRHWRVRLFSIVSVVMLLALSWNGLAALASRGVADSVPGQNAAAGGDVNSVSSDPVSSPPPNPQARPVPPGRVIQSWDNATPQLLNRPNAMERAEIAARGYSKWLPVWGT